MIPTAATANCCFCYCPTGFNRGHHTYLQVDTYLIEDGCDKLSGKKIGTAKFAISSCEQESVINECTGQEEQILKKEGVSRKVKHITSLLHFTISITFLGNVAIWNWICCVGLMFDGIDLSGDTCPRYRAS